MDVAGLAVAVVVEDEVAGGIDGGRANRANPGCGLPLIRVELPADEHVVAPTATEYGPVGVSAFGFQGSTSPGGRVDPARWRRSVPLGQYW